MSRPQKIIALLALLVMGKAACGAEVTVIETLVTYTVNEDATYAVESFQTFRPETAQGVSLISQISLPFSGSLQQIEIVDAYTTTADGKRIPVPADRIFVQQYPASTSAPVFSDQKLKVIVFPQVEPGARVTLHYKQTQTRPELPGVFSMREVFRKTGTFEHATITLFAASNLRLKANSSGVIGGEIKSARSGYREWQWNLPPSAAIAPERGSVDIEDVSPYVEASTLDSYASLARAYDAGAQSMARVTPDIQRMADDITRGISDKRAQAQALYRWVSRNIRYVAIVLDVGGYVPHPAGDVLNARYGDCKDHVALLGALLSARGIRNSPALVSASESYLLPKSAVLSAFNHVITYLPEYSLFIDSTPAFAPFGVLSDNVAGKTALITHTRGDEPVLLSTPVIGGNVDGVTVKTVATVTDDGSVTGKNTVEARGLYEFIHRSMFDRFSRDQLPQVAASLLASMGQRGSGDLSFGDPRDLTRPFGYVAEFRLPGFLKTPGSAGFALNFGIGSPVGIASMLNMAAEPERTLPFPCIGGIRTESTQLQLPERWNMSSLPAPLKYESRFGTYESSYQRTGRTISVSRTLSLHFQNPTCRGSDYPEIRALADVVSRDLRTQLSYQ